MANSFSASFELDTKNALNSVNKVSASVNSLVSELTKGIELNIDGEAAIKQAERLGDEFNNSLKAVQQTANAQKAALAQLVASGKQGTAEFAKLQKEVLATATESKRLQAALAEVDKQLEEATAGVQDLAEAQQELSPFQKYLQLEVVQAFSEQIGAIGESLSQMAEKGTATRDAMLNLAGKTGATAKEMEALKESAERAFLVGVGESVADAINAMGTAQQALKNFLPQNEIEAFVKGAGGVAQVFDKDINEVINKSRTFVANFGLDGQKSIELISFALQNSGSALDDTLDTLDEYSQLLAEAGFTAEQFVGTLVRGVQAGARDTDKLADAIKETQIRLRAGDYKAAFDEIIAGSSGVEKSLATNIKKIQDQAAQGKITVEQALTSSAELLNKAITDGSISETAANRIATAISGTPAEDLGSNLYSRIFGGGKIDEKQIQEQARAAFAGVSNALAPVNFFEQFTRQIELYATKASEFFAPVIAGAGGALQAVAGIAPAITLVTSNLGILQGVARSAWSAITGPVGIAVAGVAALTAGFIYAYKNVEPFRKAVDDALNSALAIYEQLRPALKQFTEIVMEIGGALKEVFVANMKLTISVFGGLFTAAKNIIGVFFDFGSATDATSKQTSTFGDIIKSVVSVFETGRAVVNGFVEGLKAVSQVVTDAIGALSQGNFAEAASKLFSIGEKAGEAFNKGVSDKANNIEIDKAITRVAEQASNIGTAAAKAVSEASAKGLLQTKQGREEVARQLFEQRNVIVEAIKKEQEQTLLVYGKTEQDKANIRSKFADIEKQVRDDIGKQLTIIDGKNQAEQKKQAKASSTIRSQEAIDAEKELAKQLRDIRTSLLDDTEKQEKQTRKEAYADRLKEIEALEKTANVRATELRKLEEKKLNEDIEDITTKFTVERLKREQDLLVATDVATLRKRLDVQASLAKSQRDELVKQINKLDPRLQAAALADYDAKVFAERSKLTSDIDLAEVRKRALSVAEVEAEARIATIRQTLAEQNKLYDGNTQVQKELARNAEKEIQNIRLEQLKATNEGVRIAYALQTSFAENAFDDQLSIIANIGNNISLALADVVTKQSDGLKALNENYARAIAEQTLTDEQRTAQLEKIVVQTGILIGSQLIATVAAGKDAKKAVLKSAFDILQSLVPVLVAQITGISLASPESVATFGIAGVAKAAALTAVLQGIIAAARSAVGFKEGGYTGDKGTSDVAGVVHGREFVMTADETRKHRGLFEHIHKGGDPYVFMARNMMQSNELSKLSVNSSGAIVRELQRANSRLERVESAQKAVASRFERFTRVDVESHVVITDKRKPLM
jgi:hypothetical protein